MTQNRLAVPVDLLAAIEHLAQGDSTCQQYPGMALEQRKNSRLAASGVDTQSSMFVPLTASSNGPSPTERQISSPTLRGEQVDEADSGNSDPAEHC